MNERACRLTMMKHAKSSFVHVAIVITSFPSGPATKFFQLTNRQFRTGYTDSSLGLCLGRYRSADFLAGLLQDTLSFVKGNANGTKIKTK